MDTQENAPRFSVFPAPRCSELCGQNAWIFTDRPGPPSSFIIFKETRRRPAMGAGDGDGGEVRGGCVAQAAGRSPELERGRGGPRAPSQACPEGRTCSISRLSPHRNRTGTRVSNIDCDQEMLLKGKGGGHGIIKNNKNFPFAFGVPRSERGEPRAPLASAMRRAPVPGCPRPPGPP